MPDALVVGKKGFCARRTLCWGLGIFFILTAAGGAGAPRNPSARPLGMGNAFTAVANDANAVLFNPAGLSTLKQVEFTGSFGRLLSAGASPRTELNVLGTLPLKAYKDEWNLGALGFLLGRNGQSGSDGATDIAASWGINPSRSIPKWFSSVPFIEGFSAGLLLRTRQLRRNGPGGGGSHWGLGLDLGFLYEFPEDTSPYKNGWTAGLALQEANSASISAPLRTRLGASWRHPYGLIALDLVVDDGTAKFFPGVEFPLYRKLLFLRSGSDDFGGPDRQWTLGLGVLLPPLQMDVAYGYPTGSPEKSGDRIVFSLTYRFESPLLSQYIQDERMDRAESLESKVSELESRKSSLQSSIREQKELYEMIQADTRLFKEKAEQARKTLKILEDRIAEQKQELEAMEKEMRGIQLKKERIEQGVQQRKRDQEKSDVRPPGSPGPARTHKVVTGDSLRAIAQKYYGDPNKWQFIYEANEDKILRGVPREGEELTIP